MELDRIDEILRMKEVTNLKIMDMMEIWKNRKT